MNKINKKSPTLNLNIKKIPISHVIVLTKETYLKSNFRSNRKQFTTNSNFVKLFNLTLQIDQSLFVSLIDEASSGRPRVDSIKKTLTFLSGFFK